MTAPRAREHNRPTSPPDRLPPRRGGRPSSETYSAAGRPAGLARRAPTLCLPGRVMTRLTRGRPNPPRLNPPRPVIRPAPFASRVFGTIPSGTRSSAGCGCMTFGTRWPAMLSAKSTAVGRKPPTGRRVARAPEAPNYCGLRPPRRRASGRDGRKGRMPHLRFLRDCHTTMRKSLPRRLRWRYSNPFEEVTEACLRRNHR